MNRSPYRLQQSLYYYRCLDELANRSITTKSILIVDIWRSKGHWLTQLIIKHDCQNQQRPITSALPFAILFLISRIPYHKTSLPEKGSKRKAPSLANHPLLKLQRGHETHEADHGTADHDGAHDGSSSRGGTGRGLTGTSRP